MAGFSGIDGINSGLNTTDIVEAIMELERRPAVLMEIQQAEKQAVISAYQSLQAKFLGLSTSLATLTSKDIFEQAKIDVSDESIVSVSTDSRVSTGSYDLQVLQLARNHQVASQGFSTGDSASFGTGSIAIQVGDNSEFSIVISESNNTLVGIKDAINNANAGVTASIINDGSNANAYRLILTSDKTGAENDISFTSNLIGGTDSFNFSTATFDTPEITDFNLNSTSAVSLGTTAAYTGDENKKYTFTVASTGEQTIGSDVITLNWTDGTNSGSIVVTQADTDVELVGTGSDGLSVRLSAGMLNEGDTFEIATFSPLLQAASDAKIAFGSADGSGSPITVTSSTNTFNGVVGDLDITVKNLTDAGESVTINTDLDVTEIKSKISAFLDSFNSVVEYVDEQNKYNQETDESPPLFGEYTVWSLSNSMRRNITSPLELDDGQYKQLVSVGIRMNDKGLLVIRDSAKLEEALRDNLDDVIKLFTNSGGSTSSGIEFIAGSDETTDNTTYTVDITKAATKGGFKGDTLTDPATTPLVIDSSNKGMKLKIDGMVSDIITLDEGTYDTTTELIAELQSKIDRDEKIGSRGVSVAWVDNGDGTGYVDFKSNSYGSTSKVEIDMSISNSVFVDLGLATGSFYVGQDVEGTINGEEAVGSGQFLTGKEDNKTTEGLKLKITLTEAELGVGNEGSVSFVKGIAVKNKEFIDSLTKSSTGVFDQRISSNKKQIEQLTERISDLDELLALRRESLFKQYYEMEQALGQLNAESQYLSQQLSSINSNWKFNSDSN